MTSITLPAAGTVKTRSYVKNFVLVTTFAWTLAVAFLSPAKASVKNLVSMPFSVAGLACVDFAAFHLAHGWGWLVTGISLLILEHMIADDDG